MDSNAFILRKATLADRQQIWEWANDPTMLRFAFQTTAPVPWDVHCRWFADTLSETKRTQYIVESPDHQLVGQIRFKQNGDHAIVSVFLAPAFRGKGLAAPVIQLGTTRYGTEKGVKHFVAWIKLENEPSRRAFLAAGYIPDSQQHEFAGQPAWCLRHHTPLS